MLELPITAGPVEPWTPRPDGNRILITGAAGAIGSVLADGLGPHYRLTGLDSRSIDHPGFVRTVRADVSDQDLLTELVADAEYVVHLATGVADGWEGLLATELTATKHLLEAALDHGVRRTILASSNHVSGWPERQWLAGASDGTVSPADPPQPDGVYGAAKAMMEALGRFTSDWSGLPVSVLRIGTMRYGQSLEDLIDSEELDYLGFGQQRVDRLNRTWLTHDDLVVLLREELAASEPFRLRFATSTPDQAQWDHSVFTGRIAS